MSSAEFESAEVAKIVEIIVEVLQEQAVKLAIKLSFHSFTCAWGNRLVKNLNPIWHGRGYFYPLVLFGSDFVS